MKLPKLDEVLPLSQSSEGAEPPPADEAGFVPAAPLALQDLVDAPCRALDVEFKSWRNLDHPEDQAELARDIAALANHGGGHIIFGFDERTLVPVDTEPFATRCSGERVAAIVTMYLDPAVGCAVVAARSAGGNLHPAIVVRGHGTVPVCARRDGPLVGGRRLVERGAVYVRKDGALAHGARLAVAPPASGKPETPADWAPLIRRCMRQEREGLLAAIEAALAGREACPELGNRLARWHGAAHAGFLALAPRSPYAASLARRHYGFSYAFDLARPEHLEWAQLPEFVRRAGFEVQGITAATRRMFDPPDRHSIRPRFVMDPETGDEETDFLETAWLRDPRPGETADFWRLSPRGLASIVRDYAEDRAEVNTALETDPGTWFSPNLLAQELAELVCHARAMARFFASPRHVGFRCEWWGLAGRVLFDPRAKWVQRAPIEEDRRVVGLQLPVAALGQGWTEAVAQLMAPVIRAFDPDLALDAAWVKAQMPLWRA